MEKPLFIPKSKRIELKKKGGGGKAVLVKINWNRDKINQKGL